MPELQPICDLPSALAAHAETRPHATAWRADELRGSASWREWLHIVERLRALLVDAGVRPGTTVGYRGTNHPIAWSLALACAGLGASFWPLNYRWSARELGLALDALPFEISALIVDDDASTTTREAVTRASDTSMSLRERILDRDALWADVIAERSEYDAATPPFTGTEGRHKDHDAPWLIMSTGGTTGRPKQVAHTRRTLAHNARQFAEMTHLPSDEPVLVVAPNFHVAGFSALSAAAIATGAPLYIASRFVPDALLATITRGEVRSAVMVPTMWRALFDVARRQKRTLAALRFGICGGAPMPPSYVDDARTLGFELLQGYGMTEAGPMVTLMPPGTLATHDPRRASAGIPPDDVEVWIEDPHGEPLPAGASGQIVVRGPQLVATYLGESPDPHQAFRGDAYLTGDFGHLDDAGFLYVEGRLDDVIITGGENVAPAEVESLLVEHPEVAQAAVLGVADSHWGQKIVALVCPSNPHQPPAQASLIDHLRPQLAGYKLPRELRFCDTLPLTPAGKVDRPALLTLWQKLAR
ncbi:long-chain fatty acid--CoA ligase [Lujinxingia vulgaris]|uniref:Long-chain fatty acid--CoA ligase n=1 Tax=Lujinxingia vulgaris TaxID=2600176 RepID=A0A5C6WWA4_9DELT|nr:AMP-binding protein [Lujinxingia vulgaris]TXD32123.1 long-chain fatty acid--CoA ligase [Lujinxingia vulgaris]